MIRNIIINIGTSEFFSNLAAELVGLMLEILTLSIIVPVSIFFYNLWKHRRIRFLITVELLKLYDKLTGLIVELVYGTERDEVLVDLTCPDPNDLKYIKHHELYDQLDNNLLLLKKRISPTDIGRAIRDADVNKLKEMASKSEEFLQELDRLI